MQLFGSLINEFLGTVLLVAFRKLAKSDFQLRHVSLFAWNNSARNGRIFMIFEYFFFPRKYAEKIQVALKSDKNNEHTHEDV